MRILFATGSVHPPDQVGGAERSMHTLLDLLREHGHPCEAVVGLPRGPRRKTAARARLFSLGLRLGPSDRHNGYLTHRTVPWWVPKLTRRRIQAFRPDLVITQLNRSHEIVKLALRRDLRVALMVRHAEFAQNIWPRPHPRLKIISNSKFVADQLRARLKIQSDTVYEIIRLSDYKVEQRTPETITFVNPVPLKGLDVALAIARLLPHRKFLFVEGWRLEPSYGSELRARLQPFANVAFMPWTPDIKSVYARTAVLLVPSQWQEAFGRVALEAQVNGIPVVARNVGGLGEVLEPSGVLIAPEATAEVWAGEIERLLSDPAYYGQRSAAARANAARPEFDPRYQMERFLSLVSRA